MRTLLAIAAAALLGAATQASPVAEAPAAAPGRVGVVDLAKVFESAPDRKRLEGELTAHRTQLEEQLQRLDAQLTAMKGELDLLEKGTTRYEELELQGLALQQKRAREQRRLTEEFARRKAEFHDRILAGIGQAIAALAAELGYTTVLQREFTLSQESLSWKAVLYHDPGTDLTEAVLARLQAEAGAGK